MVALSESSRSSLYVGPPLAPDRYRLRRSIGRGGEAVLYLADMQLSGAAEPVVVKALDTRTTMNTEQFSKISAAWSEQAELLRFVHRPGVVGVREHFEGLPPHPQGEHPEGAGRCLYLVMNHVDGLDLADWRAERSLRTPAERREAVRCLEQLAEVLDWLHSGSATPSGRVVVHGDLSPGNVMVNTDGQCTLVDFGLSKLAPEHRTAEVWFTPGFAAPEVYEGRRSAAADRYAFGAIVYFLLSGETPPGTPEQLRERFTALPELEALSEQHTAALLLLFDVDPERRPESLVAWVRQLRRAVITTTASSARSVTDRVTAARPPAFPHPPTQLAAPPPPASPPPSPPERDGWGSGRSRPLQAAVAVVLLGLGVWIGVSLGSGDDAKGGDPVAERSASSVVSAPPTPSPRGNGSSDGASPTPEKPVATGPEAEPSGRTGPVTLPLTAVDTVARDRAFTEGSAVIDTQEFTEALVVDFGNVCRASRSVTYHLGRSWSSLRFTAGHTAESQDRNMKLIIHGDENRVLLSRSLGLGKAERVELDVSGNLRLRITATQASSQCATTIALGAPTLTK